MKLTVKHLLSVKKLLMVLPILLSTAVFSQNSPEKIYKNFDFRFGSGLSLLGTGDYNCISFENE